MSLKVFVPMHAQVQPKMSKLGLICVQSVE